MRLLKILFKIMLVFLIILVLFIGGVAIFMNTSPQFGGKPSAERLEEIEASPNFNDGVFQNQVETIMDMSLSKMPGLLKEQFFGKETRTPEESHPVKWGEGNPEEVDSLVYVTWFGHSAFLIEMDGKRILLDPMLGGASAPVSFLTKRFKYDQPIDLADLKDIDAVIISHDHYDHLDYPTISKIKDEVKHFYSALAVGEHLKSWGIPESNITELDWGQSAKVGDLEIVATPSRHFSGRGFSDRNKTQWASWVLIGKNRKVYFSGDSGYGPHFKAIGEQYGPFDFAFIECGQYNERWSAIHMFPEESVQANVDINSKVMMPIHWGAFNLSLHDWRDPIRRARAAALEKGVKVVNPYIGERFEIGQDDISEPWWE